MRLIASNKRYFVTHAMGVVKPICLQNATNNSLMTRMFKYQNEYNGFVKIKRKKERKHHHHHHHQQQQQQQQQQL